MQAAWIWVTELDSESWGRYGILILGMCHVCILQSMSRVRGCVLWSLEGSLVLAAAAFTGERYLGSVTRVLTVRRLWLGPSLLSASESLSAAAGCVCDSHLVWLGCALTGLHVRVLTSFIKLKKLLQNLMKPLPNHIMVWEKIYYKSISDIIVNDCTTKRILKSQYIFKNFILFIFNWSFTP